MFVIFLLIKCHLKLKVTFQPQLSIHQGTGSVKIMSTSSTFFQAPNALGLFDPIKHSENHLQPHRGIADILAAHASDICIPKTNIALLSSRSSEWGTLPSHLCKKTKVKNCCIFPIFYCSALCNRWISLQSSTFKLRKQLNFNPLGSVRRTCDDQSNCQSYDRMHLLSTHQLS